MIATGFGNMTARQDQQKLMAEFEEFKERLRRSREVNQEESGEFSKAARAFADRFDAPSIDQRGEAAHSPQPHVDAADWIKLANTDPSDRSMIHDFNLIDVDVRRSYHDATETAEAGRPNLIVDADLTAMRLSHEEESTPLSNKSVKSRRWPLVSAAAVIGLVGLALAIGYWEDPAALTDQESSQSEATVTDKDAITESVAKTELGDPSQLDASAKSQPATPNSEPSSDPPHAAEKLPPSDALSAPSSEALKAPDTQKEATPLGAIEPKAASFETNAAPPSADAPSKAAPPPASVRPAPPRSATQTAPSEPKAKTKVSSPPGERTPQAPVARPAKLSPVEPEAKAKPQRLIARPPDAPAPPPPPAPAPSPSATGDPIGFMKNTVTSVTGAVSGWGQNVIGSRPW